MPAPRPKVTKIWERVYVEAKCLKSGCEQGPWTAEGSSWPQAAATRHTSSSGHKTRAYSESIVTYEVAGHADDEPAQT